MELLYACASDNSVFFARTAKKKKKKKKKKVDELNANGKTQLFTNLVWRLNAHTAVRKTSSEREKIYKKLNKKRKTTTEKQQQQQQQETNKKMGNWSRPGQTV